MKSEAYVEVIKNVTNCPVVRLSDRRFPGVVLQGDTLYALWRSARRAIDGVDSNDGQVVVDSLDFLLDSLAAMLDVYEAALQEREIMLPYVKGQGL